MAAAALLPRVVSMPQGSKATAGYLHSSRLGRDHQKLSSLLKP